MSETSVAKANYRMLIGQRQYYWFALSSFATRLADSIDSLAYVWMVYQITGSAVWLSLVAGFNALPTIFLMPFAGVLADRWNRKLVMIVCDVGRGISVLATTLLFVGGQLQPWMIVAFTLLNSTLEAFNIPAGMGILPRILPQELYSHGVGLMGSLSRVLEMIGFGIAPLIVGVWGLQGALYTDAALFLLSGLLLTRLQLKPVAAQAGSPAQENFFASLKGGIAYLKTSRLVLAICLMGCFLNAALGPANSLKAAYMQDSLGFGPDALSLSGICMLLAMAVGTWLYPMLRNRLAGRTVLVAGLFINAAAYAGLCALPFVSMFYVRYAGMCLLFGLLGIALSWISMLVNVSFMQQVEEQYLSRVGGLFNSMVLSALPVVSFLSAPAVAVMPIWAFYGMMGIMILAVAALVWLSPVFKALDLPPKHALKQEEMLENCGVQ